MYNDTTPFGGYYPGYPASFAFFAPFAAEAGDELLHFPEDAQLELLRHGGDSDRELRRKMEELREKE